MYTRRESKHPPKSIIVGMLLLVFAVNGMAANALKGKQIMGVLTLPVDYSKYIKSVVVAWSRKGEIFFLDKDLRKIHSLTLDRLRIKDVVLGDKQLLVSGSSTTPKGKSFQKVIIIDLMASKVVEQWSTTEHKIFSIAYKEKQPIMINLKGELYELKPNNIFAKIKSLAKNSFYIAIDDESPIICSSQDIMDVNSKPSSCGREGQNSWMKMGNWLGTMPPFLCGGFLIEPSQGRTKQMKNQLVVRDTKDGSIKKQKELPILLSTTCAEDKLVYAARHIYIADLPGLNTLSEESCGNQRVKDMALVGDALICLNRSLKIRKQQVSGIENSSPDASAGARKK